MRYMGGKFNLAGWIVQESIQIMEWYRLSTFVDLFAGSCNVVSKVPSSYRRIANDIDRAIMVTMEAASTGYQFPSELAREEYDRIRSSCTEGDPLYGFAAYGCSYAGKRWGGYAADDTKNKYASQAANSLGRKGRLLSGVEFYHGDYRELEMPMNSLIYCDIPYHGTTSYKGPASGFDHGQFYRWVTSQGNPVLISEYQDSYNPLCLPTIATHASKRGMRGNSGRVTTHEILRLFTPTSTPIYLG